MSNNANYTLLAYISNLLHKLDISRRDDRFQQSMMPADMFGSGGSMFDGMFGNMHRMMNTMMADMNTQMVCLFILSKKTNLDK